MENLLKSISLEDLIVVLAVMHGYFKVENSKQEER